MNLLHLQFPHYRIPLLKNTLLRNLLIIIGEMFHHLVFGTNTPRMVRRHIVMEVAGTIKSVDLTRRSHLVDGFFERKVVGGPDGEDGAICRVGGGHFIFAQPFTAILGVFGTDPAWCDGV